VICKLVYDVVMALVYCHAKGIAHLDLSLENILIDGTNTFKLTGFGSTKICDKEVENVPSLAGKVSKKSPEVAKKNVLIQSDIWGLGCVLYQMCTIT